MPSKKIESVAASLNKHFKKSVIFSASKMPKTPRVRLGRDGKSLPMADYVMGGGVPRNRMIELYGLESAGKSYVSYLAIAGFQHYDFASSTQDAFEDLIFTPDKKDKDLMSLDKAIPRKELKLKDPEVRNVVLVDYENSYDAAWGAHLGINNDGLIRVVPERGTECVDIVQAFLGDPTVSLVVLDSIRSVAPDVEIDTSMEKEQMGVSARFWNKAVRKFQSAMNSNPNGDITFIFINGITTKIGQMFGNPDDTFGGKGLKYGKALSLYLYAQAPLKGKSEDGEDIPLGKNVIVENKKNKTSTPFLKGSYYHAFVDDDFTEWGKTDVLSQIVDLGLRHGLIKRAGSYLSYNKVKAQGRDNFISEIVDADIVDTIIDEVYATVFV